MLKHLLCCVALCVIAGTATAQSVQVSSYLTLSSLRSVRAVALDHTGRIWAATSGGVFVYTDQNTPVTEYRNIDAMLSLDATAIFFDPADSLIYVGGENGSLDIATANGKWTNITDISRASQYQRRTIRGFAKKGDTLFIASDLGVLLYNTKQQVFVETIDRIGRLQEKTAVNGIVILRDSIWVATDSGMAVAPLNVNTLRLPTVWSVYDTVSGLPTSKVSFITSAQSQLYVGCASQALVWTGSIFSSLVTTSQPVNGISISENQLYVSSSGGIVSVAQPIVISWSNELLGHSTIVKDGKVHFIGFIVGKGLEISNLDSLISVKINSPVSNQFARIALDNDGGLWVATDVEPPRAGEGVSYFDGTNWQNFNTSNTPQIQTRACYRVSAVADGSIWIGTWGKGAVQAKKVDGEIQFKLFNSQNSVLQGIAADPNYLLVADVAQDRQGNTWIVNEQSASVLAVKLNQDETSKSFPNCVDPGSTLFRSIAVDGAGNKWIGSVAGIGIVGFNERNVDISSDDVCNYIRTSNTQLPDNVINVLRIDKSGSLWIGTPKGVAVISAPSQLSNTTVPYVRRISLLSSAVVNDIYVDALNYKWVATSTGVFVLNEDGTQVLLSLSKSNAPLLDDNIRCIAVDDKTGLAYFGTSYGCTVARSSSIKPVADYNIEIHPQPFSPQLDNEVIINGLAADSDIRIMTTGGFLVTAFQTKGKQTTWDGTDTLGRTVPPGVYLIHATSATSGQSTIAKLMVRR
ncbi:MAG: hypothetical protein HQ472_02205 [Ignavibacteria bacterium]|nr:hypothetical protein [Ignavibacteria bacterium]